MCLGGDELVRADAEGDREALINMSKKKLVDNEIVLSSNASFSIIAHKHRSKQIWSEKFY